MRYFAVDVFYKCFQKKNGKWKSSSFSAPIIINTLNKIS